jgi:hypothetical protein
VKFKILATVSKHPAETTKKTPCLEGRPGMGRARSGDSPESLPDQTLQPALDAPSRGGAVQAFPGTEKGYSPQGGTQQVFNRPQVG